MTATELDLEDVAERAAPGDPEDLLDGRLEAMAMQEEELAGLVAVDLPQLLDLGEAHGDGLLEQHELSRSKGLQGMATCVTERVAMITNSTSGPANRSSGSVYPAQA